MRYLKIITCFILVANFASAQQSNLPKSGTITSSVSKSDTLYGYVINGKQVLKNKFEEIGPFGRRVAIVKLNGKFGFIDEMGKIIVKPVYQKAKMVSGFGVVFDEKEKGWKIVGSFGLDSPYTYSDIQELPFGCVLVRKNGEQKSSLLLFEAPSIHQIDSVQITQNDQLLLFFSAHKNGKQISQNKQTDSIPLFTFYPDFKHSNYRNREYPYFKYTDNFFKSKDSSLIIKSYFSNTVYYYDFNKPFSKAKKGTIQHLGGKSYTVEVIDSVSTKWDPQRGLLLNKGWYFEPVVPLQKNRRISTVNNFIMISNSNKRGYAVFDFEGENVAVDVENVKAMNASLTLIETSRYNYNLYKDTQLLAKSHKEPIKCNNEFFMLIDTSFSKYVFINQEGNIVGDTFDLFYEKNTSLDAITMFGKLLTGAVLFETMVTGDISIPQTTEYVPLFFNTFITNSKTDKQIVVTKYVEAKKLFLFGTMYENGEINIPLKYNLLKPVNDWGFIFSIYTKNGHRFGLLDWNGTQLIAPNFSTMAYNTENGLLKVTQNKRTFYIDKNGNEQK